MPVFFFVDPLFIKDRRFDAVNRITLSYIFYESTSELPEEYKHLSLSKARPTNQLPPEKDAPEKRPMSSGKPVVNETRKVIFKQIKKCKFDTKLFFEFCFSS